jgi:putative membrane protein
VTNPPVTHDGHPTGSDIAAADFPWLTLLLFGGTLLLACGYLLGAAELRRRNIVWPRGRDASFGAGCAFLVIGGLAPFPFGEFTSHVARHLIVAMLVPLLLVLGRPVTLLLRVLRPGRARRTVLNLSRTRAVSVLMFPLVAALVDIGGLWLLYRTPLFSRTHDNLELNVFVHLHMLIAGTLLTAAVCQLDPVRHRYGVVLRSASLVLAAAVHAVLAKTLYTSAPPGTSIGTADLQQGAQLMYYGGDVVEVAVAVVLAVGWYRDARRQYLRGSRPDPQLEESVAALTSGRRERTDAQRSRGSERHTNG